MKNHQTIILIVAFIIIALGGIAAGYLISTGSFAPKPTATATAAATSTSTQTSMPTPTVSPTLTVATSSENITVTMPKPYEEVVSPLHVEGTARVFENLLNIRLKNQAGKMIALATAYASAPDVGQFGPFSADLTFVAQTGMGTLEVYSISPLDGSEINLVAIPVKFKR